MLISLLHTLSLRRVTYAKKRRMTKSQKAPIHMIFWPMRKIMDPQNNCDSNKALDAIIKFISDCEDCSDANSKGRSVYMMQIIKWQTIYNGFGLSNNTSFDPTTLCIDRINIDTGFEQSYALFPILINGTNSAVFSDRLSL